MGNAVNKAFTEEEDEAELFQKALLKAVKALGTAAFGRAPSGEEGRFDRVHWEVVKDDDPEVKLALKVKHGIKASDAIRKIIEGHAYLRQVWSIDCAEFVQLANLYAMLTLHGDEWLDELQAKDKRFVLRPHNSTGFRQKSRRTLQREAKEAGSRFLLFKDEKPEGFVTRSETELLDLAPVGARVSFFNGNGHGTPFHNENTVKVGKDQYAAHGLGLPNVFSRREIIRKLEDYNERAERERGSENIFVFTIEYLGPRDPSEDV